MPKRPKGNPRWSQGLQPAPTVNTPSEFERLVRRLRLSPEKYGGSPELRAWVEKNWRQKFVPEKLLRAFHLSEFGLSDSG